MKYFKVMILSLVIYLSINPSGYCLYRDDVSFDEAKEKIEMQRQISKEDLAEDKQQGNLKQENEPTNIGLTPSNSSGKESRPKLIKMILSPIILLMIALGYLYYRRRQR